MHVVNFLIKENVNLDKIDQTGVSPLYHAIMKGQEDIAKMLHYKGASVHAPLEKLAKLLCICGFKGDILRVRLLKECEADIEVSDYDLRTVGHLAAAEGHWDLVTYLAKHTHFNFNLKDRWGKTPLDEITDDVKREEYIKMIKDSRTNFNHSKTQSVKIAKEQSSSEDDEEEEAEAEAESKDEAQRVAKMLEKKSKLNH
jgi:ankyrin repeat protein